METGGKEQLGKKTNFHKITVGNSPSPNVAKATSKIGSLTNTNYKPSGGKVKIESKKLNWSASSKVGSLQNVGHVPGGGGKKVLTKKDEKIETKSRVGSLDNVKYQAGGGGKKIFDDKEYMKRVDERRRSSSLARD